MKIKITINGNEVELSPDEARRIHGELSGLFALPIQKEYVPFPYPVNPLPVYPTYHELPFWQQPITTCGAGGVGGGGAKLIC